MNIDRPCLIINVSSVASDKLYEKIFPYSIHKKALDLACLQLQQIDSKCRVINIKLGRMDTEMVAHRTGPKLDPNYVANEIAKLIDACQGHALIKELVIDNYYGG